MNAPRWILFVGLVLALRPAFAQTPTTENVNALTLREKVGQLFLIGFPQDHLDTSLKTFIRTQKPGGFILFRRNLKDTAHIRAFTNELSKTSKVARWEPLLAVDQEGGSVTRVPVFPSLPSALSVGLTDRVDLSLALGEESGRILRWMGFNLNLAPVLDLSDPKTESFIGSRSFGADPVRSGKMGYAYAQGLRNSGVVPTGKHFPGLGATAIDLHLQAAGSKQSPELFRARDLKPFAMYSELGATSALMVSQMSYPLLDPSGLPAPFSKKILKDLLRGELGFKGLVMTDDLQMKGSAVTFAAKDAALESLKAGADLVMISWSMKDQIRAMRRVEEAVRKGEWPESELNERVARILAVKRGLKEMATGVPPALARGPFGIPATKRLEKIDLEILDAKLQSLQSLSGKSKIQAERPCVLTSDANFASSFRRAFGKGMRHFPITRESHLPAFRSNLKTCDLMVYTVNGKRTAQVLSLFSEDLQKKTLVVNFGPASLVKEAPWVLRVEIAHPHLQSGFRIAQFLRNLGLDRQVASQKK